ncbi:unnamed protein product [Rotaria sp. Silwood2]|nr:unnamed protein product [Rotaria sp. Silwood2]
MVLEEFSQNFYQLEHNSKEMTQKSANHRVAIIEHKSIICSGYSAVFHIHAAAVEVQLKKLITLIDRKTGERTQEHRRFIKHNQVAIARFELTQSDETISMEPFKRFPQLSHFMLRDEVMVEPLLLVKFLK